MSLSFLLQPPVLRGVRAVPADRPLRGRGQEPLQGLRGSQIRAHNRLSQRGREFLFKKKRVVEAHQFPKFLSLSSFFPFLAAASPRPGLPGGPAGHGLHGLRDHSTFLVKERRGKTNKWH